MKLVLLLICLVSILLTVSANPAQADLSMSEFLGQLENKQSDPNAPLKRTPDIIVGVEGYNSTTDAVETRHYKLTLDVDYSLSRFKGNDNSFPKGEVLPVWIRLRAVDGSGDVEGFAAYALQGASPDYRVSETGGKAKVFGITVNRLSELIREKLVHAPFTHITSLSIFGLEGKKTFDVMKVGPEGIPVKIYAQGKVDIGLPEISGNATVGVRVGRVALQAGSVVTNSQRYDLKFKRWENELSANYQLARNAAVSVYTSQETVEFEQTRPNVNTPLTYPETIDGQTSYTKKNVGVRLLVNW